MNVVGLDTWARTSPRDELDAVVSTLGPDEVRVLVRIASRLKAGEKAYGRLDVAGDGRDFGGKEAREELEDALVYVACAWLKREAAE